VAAIADQAEDTTGVHGVGARHVAETSVEDLDLAAHKTRHEFGGADAADFTDWVKQDRAVIVHENGSNFDKATLWTQSLSAGMTFTQAMVGSYFITDATANRIGYLYTTVAAFTVLDWFHWIALTPGGASDFLAWLWISNTAGASTPVAGQRYAGFKLINGKIWSYSSDSVAEESNEIADLGATNTSYMLRWTASTMQFYINGVLEATHTTRIPSGVQQAKMYLTNTANVAKSLYIRTIGIRRV